MHFSRFCSRSGKMLPCESNIKKRSCLCCEVFVLIIAWFVEIFGINTTRDISKLLYVISQAVRRVKFETILKCHMWYLCQISSTNRLLFVNNTTRKRFVIFTCRYFKLSLNTTALSQSNCRNFSCTSIIKVIFMTDLSYLLSVGFVSLSLVFDHVLFSCFDLLFLLVLEFMLQ